MLFRPRADQNLGAVQAMLGAWNAEADGFRRAAAAVRTGETTDSLAVAAAEQAHDGLLSLLDELDYSLATAEPGSAQFAALLRAQTSAVALLESVGNSCDILDSRMAEPMTAPIHIAHVQPAAVK